MAYSAWHRGQTDFLETVPAGVDTSPFCMGPLARRDFWEDGRVSMEVDRGPWASALEYVYGVAIREQEWIDLYANPHIHDDFLCGVPLQGKFCLPSSPKTVAISMAIYGTQTCMRQDLFVVPSGSAAEDGKIQANITSRIDWQGAWAGPAFLQLTVPIMFRASGGPEALSLPPKFETLDTATRKEAERFHNEAVLQKQFETLVLQDITQLPALAERRQLEALAQGAWRAGLLPFREILIKVTKRWNDIAPGQECPISFTPLECEEHAGAYAYWVKHRARASALDEEFSLEECGYVVGDQAHFANVQAQLEKRREEWIASGNTDEERMIGSVSLP